ncbi:MAG: hypothetical protein A3E79_12360 [Burkholderiales bacterium RIFCSPHIGHO2_12_FULL_61_11]|nr:MAG: hypothetical protein A3E79_12360 [Burkholderiales bacterium RIFCSPHIGHO2_12_FULL_61_11]
MAICAFWLSAVGTHAAVPVQFFAVKSGICGWTPDHCDGDGLTKQADVKLICQEPNGQTALS